MEEKKNSVLACGVSRPASKDGGEKTETASWAGDALAGHASVSWATGTLVGRAGFWQAERPARLVLCVCGFLVLGGLW